MNTTDIIGKHTFLFTLLLLLSVSLTAQDFNKQTPTLKIGNNGGALSFSGYTALWARYTELTPGSSVNGESKDQMVDFSIRKIRMGMTGYLIKNLFIKFQIGNTNMNYLNPNAFPEVLDLYMKYEVSDHFKIGFGKSNYMGLSRYSAISGGTMITLEIPVFALTTVNISDRFTRKMSLFTEGQLGKLDYTLVLARPFIVNTSTEPGEHATFSNNYPSWQPSGYVMYQFFDKEGQRSSTATGTYLGTKKIVSVGAGFQYQSEATWTQNMSSDTARHDMLNLTADIIVDLPLNKGNTKSLTFYTCYYNYNFGPNYLRNIGINNPANGSNDTNYLGWGNMFPAQGTGQIIHSQFGIRFATPKIKRLEALLPYVSVTRSDFDALDEPMVLLDFGLNWLLNGHRSKITIGLQNRPIYSYDSTNELTVSERKQTVVLQYIFKI